MEKETKMYEIGHLLSPLIPEEKIDEEISVLRKLIEDKNGFIMNEGRSRMQRLAYPIKKFDVAYFGWIKFVASPDVIEKVKKSFDLLLVSGGKLIRFLITESFKETMAQRPIKRIIKKKTLVEGEDKEKLTIKPEEIDKKIEELVGE